MFQSFICAFCTVESDAFSHAICLFICPSADEEERLIPEGISSECVVQCWFRFLHILGNPVELSRPSVIASTPKFLHMALTSEVPVEPEDHECLKLLPYIFYRAMKSVAVVADAFLGNSLSSYFSHKYPKSLTSNIEFSFYSSLCNCLL